MTILARVLVVALLALSWRRLETALHADTLVSTAMFLPLVFLALFFWRATAP